MSLVTIGIDIGHYTKCVPYTAACSGYRHFILQSLLQSLSLMGRNYTFEFDDIRLSRDRARLLTGEVDLFATLYTVLPSRAADHTWTYPMFEIRTGFVTVKRERAWYDTSKGYFAPYTWSCWMAFAMIAMSAMVASITGRWMNERKHVAHTTTVVVSPESTIVRIAKLTGIASESLWLLANRKLYFQQSKPSCQCQKSRDSTRHHDFDPPMSTKVATVWFSFLVLMMIPLYRTHLLSGILVDQRTSSVDTVYDVLDGLRSRRLKLVANDEYTVMAYYRSVMEPSHDSESVLIIREAIVNNFQMVETYEDAIEMARNDDKVIILANEVEIQPFLATNCDLKYIHDPINGVQVVSYMLAKHNMKLAAQISEAIVGLASHIYHLRSLAFRQEVDLCGMMKQREITNLHFGHIQAAVYFVATSGLVGLSLLVLENVASRLTKTI